MWRLVLLQRTAGYWELSESLAFALEAHAGPLPPAGKPRASSAFAKMRMLLDPPDDLDDLIDGEEQDTEFEAEEEDHHSTSMNDCPLTFTRAAVLRRMPHELLKALPDVHGRERLWATVLALAGLQKSDAGWLRSGGDEPARTVVDAAREYIAGICAHNRLVRRLVRKGVLAAAAEKALKRWKAATEYAIQQSRDADVVTRFNAVAHVQRAGSRIVKSIMTDHDTFSTFLDENGFIMRWQASCSERCCAHIARSLTRAHNPLPSAS